MCEILAPAGDGGSFSAALNSGANAIYLGLDVFSARANAENFNFASLEENIRRAHIAGVKVYVAMNTLVKDGELNDFLSALLKAYSLGADAIIMQDVFLGEYIHSLYPDIILHLSTQAGTNNVYGAKIAKECGFSRVILSRETSIEEIAEITKIIETEVFIQGALCSSFSGQCYMSSFAGGNSGNRGRCKQPCRKKYSYSRKGFSDPAYALSLSDLCVGDKIFSLVKAGVYSFKIEGRMRRAEYVAAAVNYYKALLCGNDGKKELSDLKRTFNRGNYTCGLAFGQDKRFLSRSVQGHIGEKVGTVTVKNKKYYVESLFFLSKKGDCFKILRGGKEVGGAAFFEKDKRGFYITSSARLINGDGVFVTTDTALNERLLSAKTKREISARVVLKAGEIPFAECKELGVKVFGGAPLSAAVTRPVTKEEVVSCFNKSEEFSSSPEVIIEGGAFIVKSALNALRRDFFNEAEKAILSEEKIPSYEFKEISLPSFSGDNSLTAIISQNGINSDVFIFKPHDYNNAAEYSAIGSFTGEKYLYLPAFMSSRDISIIEDKLPLFDGVYAEGIWGALYAREKGKKLFAGTGFNLTNSIAVNEVKRFSSYYALSKELTFSEQRSLSSKNSFVLSAGNIKVMDFVYCPFSKTCGDCDKLFGYTLTDENSRKFPVGRYVMSSCRFEVYNCAALVSVPPFGGRLYDFSLISKDKAEAVLSAGKDENKIKELLPSHTSGHRDREI